MTWRNIPESIISHRVTLIPPFPTDIRPKPQDPEILDWPWGAGGRGWWDGGGARSPSSGVPLKGRSSPQPGRGKPRAGCWSAFSGQRPTQLGRCPSRSWRPLKCHLFVAWTLLAGRRHVTWDGIFGRGGGAAWRASTGPWTGSLDAQCCCLAAAGFQVRHQQPLIPAPRGPRGRQPPGTFPRAREEGEVQGQEAVSVPGVQASPAQRQKGSPTGVEGSETPARVTLGH